MKKGRARGQQKIQLANGKKQMSMWEMFWQARAQETFLGKKVHVSFPQCQDNSAGGRLPVLTFSCRMGHCGTLLCIEHEKINFC